MSRVTTKETITPRQQPLVFTPHVLLDMTSLVVKKVACGDSFMAFLTGEGGHFFVAMDISEAGGHR